MQDSAVGVSRVTPSALARMRADMFSRHLAERAALRNMQAAENNSVAAKRKPGRFARLPHPHYGYRRHRRMGARPGRQET